MARGRGVTDSGDREGRGRLLFTGKLVDLLIAWTERLRAVFAPEPYEPDTRLLRADYGLAAAFALISVALALYVQNAFDQSIYAYWNIYFQGDPNRVIVDVTVHDSQQWRTGVHPNFSILLYPFAHGLMLFGASPLLALKILTICAAAIVGGAYFLAARGLGLPRLVAAAFVAVFLASASVTHWLGLIETYPFAAASLAVALFVATTQSGKAFWIWTLTGAWVFGITITNWALTLATSFFRLDVRDFIKVSLLTAAIVVAISIVQDVLFPHARLFFDPYNIVGEFAATQPALADLGLIKWTPIENLRAFLLTSAVAPEPYVEVAPTPVGPFTLVNNQFSSLTEMSALALAATGLWVALLAGGLWGIAREKKVRAIGVPVLAYVLFQAALCNVYGEITFIYWGNYFPCLAFITVFGWFTPWRRRLIVIAAAFVVLAGVNNLAQFNAAAAMANEIAADLDRAGGVQSVPPAS